MLKILTGARSKTRSVWGQGSFFELWMESVICFRPVFNGYVADIVHFDLRAAVPPAKRTERERELHKLKLVRRHLRSAKRAGDEMSQF